ncbi:MAG: family 43 glycosylhydrolase [Bacteroidales bacterium]|nr:family 43 glycosylhydrolase [Bacteroidales bacterium]
MKIKKNSSLIIAAVCGAALIQSCSNPQPKELPLPQTLESIGNPFMPLWEHIPDGEPYVFEDPDNPGQYRVYLYGSHDIEISNYCGRDQVVWSAPVNNLKDWRLDGVIFKVDKNGKGEAQQKADMLYAPDVTVKTEKDGTKTYYLYPNNQEGGRNGMVAKSKRPDGPFEVCNWDAKDPNKTDGILAFDPAVFVDDDGKVYGYWGFEHSYAAELDPETMATVKKGTKVVENMISGRYDDGIFSFFEASSMRKIKDKYVFIYSRFTKDGEFGLPVSNYTLAYAYGDSPLGPWTYGGTIIDGRGREKDSEGKVIASATVDGNTHGSICEINGKWWVFYHRQTGTDEYARQAMVAPITVNVEEGAGGKVEISEGEYNSEGFETEGLNPLQWHAAAIACWYTGSKTAIHEWPNNTFFGSYIASTYGTDSKISEPYAYINNINPVVNNTDGSIVGYKYFNFDQTKGKKEHSIHINLIPEGIDGNIDIVLDRPWTFDGGRLIGSIHITPDMPKNSSQLSVYLPELANISGKHAVYFVFSSPEKEKSICTLESFVFDAK